MATRVLAFVAAVAMVAGAIAVRSRLEEGGAAGGGDDRLPRLVCSPELEAACNELAGGGRAAAEVIVEPAGVTADRLVGVDGDPGLDGWLVPGPYPQIVDAMRTAASRDPLFPRVDGPVARSPLVIVVWPERASALRGTCPEQAITWRCLGDAAPKQWSAVGGRPEWGPVKVRHADAGDHAVGLLVVAAATSNYFGRMDFDLIDLEEGDFQGWFAGLEETAGRAGSSPLDRMLLTRAEVDAVGTVEAEAKPKVDSAAQMPEVIYPDPMVTADVVLGVRPGKAGEATNRLVGRRAGAALARSGWRVEGHPPARGIDARRELPPGDGLPAPGVLGALRKVHEEVTR